MRVPGKGPTPCDILLCGEGPGYAEDRRGEPFVGKTGDEIDRLLAANGLPSRHELFLTNLYRQYEGKDYEYTAADLERDEPDLLAELRVIQPTTVVPLGRVAARWFLGDVDIQAVQGLPYLISGERWGGGVLACLPLVHPAAGLHNSDMSPYVVSGFAALADYLAGRLAPRRLYDDPIPQPQYQEATTETALRDATVGCEPNAWLSIDSEGWFWNPWSVQFCHRAGQATCVRTDRSDLLQSFGACLSRVRPRLLFHSALHDLGMLRAVGIDVEGLQFDDTLVMAYLLQLEPQGLKAACLRHANMQMDDYSDLVREPDEALARDYLTWLWEGEQWRHEEARQAEFTRRRLEGRRIKVLPKLPKTALHKATERVLRSPRARALWADQVEDIQVEAYQQHGAMPDASLDYVDRRTAVHYGCRDADGTLRLAGALSERIDALGLRGVYELELSTYPFIERMQRIGVKPDLAHFAELSQALGCEIQSLQQELEQATGRPAFNANSGDQVADYLFGQLGLEEIKRTSSGRGSTNDKVLEALEREHPEHPAIALVRSYRETYKLKHTFVDRLPDFVDRWPFDGRIHCNFRTTRVVTGRLAANDPNLLAQPEHGKFAKDFKRGWIAEDGHTLCQWDESQLELRTLAHLCQDPVLLSAFRGELRNDDGSKMDLHARLAQRIFGVEPKNQDKHKHRYPAKTIHFLICMGGTAHGLSVQLRANGVDVDEDDAQRWLDDTMQLYQNVQPFINRSVEEAKRYGFVRWHPGRIRYIGGIHSRDDRIRAEAERFSFSTKIQGLAQTLMKIAETVIWNEVLPVFWKRQQWVEPILQVHDCIKAECDKGVVEELHEAMSVAMTRIPDWFTVPLEVEGEHGSDMADMVSF